MLNEVLHALCNCCSLDNTSTCFVITNIIFQIQNQLLIINLLLYNFFHIISIEVQSPDSILFKVLCH